MKKGGVAREIKGCRRRCLHHPAPTSASETDAKGAGRSEREKERIRDETHNTPHRAVSRARWYACHTLSSPLAARVAKARALTTLTLYDTARPWIYAGYHT